MVKAKLKAKPKLLKRAKRMWKKADIAAKPAPVKSQEAKPAPAAQPQVQEAPWDVKAEAAVKDEAKVEAKAKVDQKATEDRLEAEQSAQQKKLVRMIEINQKMADELSKVRTENASLHRLRDAIEGLMAEHGKFGEKLKAAWDRS